MEYPSTSRRSGRKSSGRQSDHRLVSPEAGFPNHNSYPPRSSSRQLTPPDLTSSTQRSGGGSGRSSRTSGIMTSLFGRRGSRRERSDSDPSSPRCVPVVKDVFLKPSVPGYICNGTGWENMSAPPYEHRLAGAAATTGPTTGAPYALSNIPAQIYLLQPQQPAPGHPGSSSMEGHPSFLGQTSVSTPTAATAPMPQFVSPYYSYPQQTIFQRPNAGVAGVSASLMPFPMPLHEPATNGSMSSPDLTHRMSRNGENIERSRPRSPESDASFSHAGGREERNPTSVRRRAGRHSRQRSCDSSVAEPTHRSRHRTPRSRSRRDDHRRSSSHHRDRRRSRSVPKKVRVHICNGCGRVRSRKFHDANPVRPGKKPVVNFCRKCRGLFDMELGK